MQRTNWKILLIFITTFIVLGCALTGCLTNQSMQQYDRERDFIVERTNSNDSLIITGYKGKNTEVRIPSQINGRLVVGIDRNAFSTKGLTSITIPDSVTSIGEGAFRDNQFTSVTIPNNVTSIEKEVFANNPLINVVIDNGIGSLKEEIFEDSLEHISQITIGANVNLTGASDVVWTGFSSFYLVNGNRAGTYTLSNGRWSAQYR